MLLQDLGCFSIVLESVPARLAGWISEQLEIPTIGIGAGPRCDGQVLVTHDLLGLFDRLVPRFVRQYADLNFEMQRAFRAYRSEVEEGVFPAPEHTVEMPDEEWLAFQSELQEVAA